MAILASTDPLNRSRSITMGQTDQGVSCRLSIKQESRKKHNTVRVKEVTDGSAKKTARGQNGGDTTRRNA